MLASCAGKGRFEPGQHLTVVQQTQLPPPVQIGDGSSARPYRIGAYDKLSVSVFGVPEMSQVVQADASGRISMPLIGAIEAAGKSPEDLANEIEDRLRGRYVRNPQVTINLDETVSQVITVDGEVREPGLYPVVGQMTLMRAIATAKGATEFARLDDVVVFRDVGDHQMAGLYNLQAIRQGAYQDPEVFANDVIIVGDSPSRRLFRDLMAAAPLLSAPLIAIVNSGL